MREAVEWACSSWRVLGPHPNHSFPPSSYYRVFQLLVERLQPKVCIELGTCGGGAALHMALGDRNTRVITIDHVQEPTVPIALDIASNLEFWLDDSVDAAKRLPDKSVDILFIDTTHTHEQTMAEYNAWIPKMKKRSIIIFDDVRRPGMWECVQAIEGTKIHQPRLGGDGGMIFLLIGEA